MRQLSIVTGNKNKADEYGLYAKEDSLPINFSIQHVEIPELQNDDPERVLLSKVEYIAKCIKLPFCVEDTVFFSDRFPNFPGINTRFVNKTLGSEGWKRLFTEGDSLRAVTRIAVHVFGKTEIFIGELVGSISFIRWNAEDGPTDINMPLNSLFYIKEKNAFLDEALKDKTFFNHRRRAFQKMCEWIKGVNISEQAALAEISENWNNRADDWNNILNDPKSYVNYEIGYARFDAVVRKILPIIPPHSNVLDIGCGTGKVAELIAGKRADVVVFGQDISGKMINEANRRIELQGTKISFSVGELNKVGFKENSFDFFTSRGVVLSHIPVTAAVDFLNTVTRLARPDAYLILDFIQNLKSGDFPPKRPLTEWSSETVGDIMRELGWLPVYDEEKTGTRVRIMAFQMMGSEKYTYFVTGNPLKVIELSSAMGASEKTLAFASLPLKEIKSDSVEEIVLDKVRQSYTYLRKPVLCTDGGIFINALKGFPGCNSKQAAERLGARGILTLMKGVADRSAIRRNAIAFFDGKNEKIMVSEVDCLIAEEVRELHPSYELDKILIPASEHNKQKLTYSEMPVEGRVEFTELPQMIKFVAECRKLKK